MADPFMNEPPVDPFMNEPVTHDACRCKQDQETLSLTLEPASMADPACECPCQTCVNCRTIHAGIVRRARLELRLAEMEIDLGDLADIVWNRFFADGLESWVRKRVGEMLRDHLCKLRLKSLVEITGESIQGLENGRY